MSKIIYLATTKGCYACAIMTDILTRFHKDNKYDFDIKILDFTELPDWIKINVPIGDFPILIFVDNNVIKYHYSGTTTIKKLKTIIEDIKF